MSDVLVIGGGLAGLATAAALAPRGHRVTVLESRSRLGGRAGSFADPASGQLVDACQHVSMGCCTAFTAFCQTVGIGHLLEPQPILYFMTPDGRVSRFAADPLPAPFHLSRAFWRAHYLTAADKLRIAWGMFRLFLLAPDDDRPLRPWLVKHRQNQRTIDRFWGVVLVSALNESVERVGLKYARQVFVDAFLTDRKGFEIRVPSVPLDRLYGEELRSWFERNGISIETAAGVAAIETSGERVAALRMRDGSQRMADWYVAAVPAARLLDLLPDRVVQECPLFAGLRDLEVSPITSVHLWYDRSVTDLPHVVLVDCLGQWLFNRGEIRPGEFYVQIVISAARSLKGLGNGEIGRQVIDEVSRLFKVVAPVRSKVVTEHAATFAPVPGVDRWRPGPRTPLANLILAGDWTATGWPATMEGAVRSGNTAAAAVPALPFRAECEAIAVGSGLNDSIAVRL